MKHWRNSLKRSTAIVASVTCAAAALGALAAPASAGISAGYHMGSGWKGTRANLNGTASVEDHAGIIGTVRVQAETDGSSDGLYQAGDIKQGPDFTLDCGTGFTGEMVERHNDSLSGSYLCNTYHSGTFNDDHRFTVRHTGSGWEALRDGDNLDGPYDLNFPGGYPYAVSEKYNTIDSYTMRYGPFGETPWQVLNDNGNWNTVDADSAHRFNDGDYWGVSDLPCPFLITR